jgi:uracil-DNA glycosylase family 4
MLDSEDKGTYICPKRDKCTGCAAYKERGAYRGVGKTPADIVFLSDAAPDTSEDRNATKDLPFSDRSGRLLKSLVRDLMAETSETFEIVPFYTYSVQCTIKKPNIDVIHACSEFAQTEILLSKAKVVVALGATAMKCLNIPGTVKDRHGTVQKLRICHTDVRVVCTYSPSALLRKENIGITELFKTDVRKALNLCVEREEKPVELDELTKNYIKPKTLEEVKEVCSRILEDTKKGGLLAVDTETTGLDAWNPTLRCIAISFAWDKGLATTILLDHKRCPYDWKKASEYVKEVLKSPVGKVYHNYKYDFQVIECKLGWEVTNVVFDTMLAEHLLEEDKKGYYGLKEIVGTYCPDYKGYEDALWEHLKHNPYAKRLEICKERRNKFLAEAKKKPKLSTLDKKSDKYKALKRFNAVRKKVNELYKKYHTLHKSFTEKISNLTFEDVPVDEMILYAAIDADVTRQIAIKQYAQMSKQIGLTNVMCTVSIPASRTLGRMSYDGFRVDLDYLTELEGKLDQTLQEMEDNIFLEVGYKFNLNAKADLVKVIQDIRGHKLTVRTTKDTGFKLSKDILLEMYTKTQDPVLQLLLDHSEAYKARHTFLKGIRKLSAVDGKIHTSFNLHGTATGRLSSASPNLQNIPKFLAGHNIKKLFIPDDPDTEILINADYSAAEIRILTAYAKDDKLIQAILNGLDVHSYITSEIYKLPYEDVANREKYQATDPALYTKYDKLRTYTKRAVFLTIYGGGANALQSQLAVVQPGITLEECERIMNLLLEGFPAIRRYMSGIEMAIHKQGYVTTQFGRRRRFELAKYDWKLRNAALREAINAPIQGTSSDVVLSQVIELGEHINEVQGKLKITVHDSVVFSVKKEHKDNIKNFLQKWAVDRVSEKYPWLPVPFAMDAEVGRSYGECDERVM